MGPGARVTRKQPMALARQVAFWCQRELTGADGARIGIWWGNMDRTTVNYGIHQVTLRLTGQSQMKLAPPDRDLQTLVRGVAEYFRKPPGAAVES
jgi:Bacterial dnaA protein helix-turn-helix